MGMFDDLIPGFDDLIPAEPPPEPAQADVNPQGVRANLMDAFQTVDDATTGVGMGIPFSDEIIAGAATPFQVGKRAITGEDEGKPILDRFSDAYSQVLEHERGIQEQAVERSPVATTAGQVAGAGMLLPGTAGSGGLASQAMRGSAVAGGYGALEGAGQGEGLEDRLTRGAEGAGIGLAVGGLAAPVVAGAQAVGRGVRSLAAQPVNAVRGLVRPEAEAARRVTAAQERDVALGGVGLKDQEFRAAQFVGQPVTNLERGGETTRALARSAANTSPEARAVLSRTIDDRFESQGPRVTGFIRGLVGRTDATAAREGLKQSARAANKPAYKKAYQDGDGGLWSPEMQRLAGSPAVLKAMRTVAMGKGQDRAIAEGFGAFQSGVKVSDTGVLSFRKGKGGVPAYPNLQYWDYVKRELDDAASAAFRSGNNDAGSVLSGLARNLRDELDKLVPSYNKARSTAAKFFDAEDALEAGENFVRLNVDHSLARNAVAKMNAAERKLFQEGFASRLIDQIGKTGDRRNVVNSIFGSVKAREKMEIALGPHKARQLETFLRAETVMDLARGAVQGNSTTARQLIEMGLAGGASGYTTGDPTNIIVGALAWGAARRGLTKIDENVTRRVGEMLASDNPVTVNRAINRIAGSFRLMEALKAASGATGAVAAQQSVP